MAKSDLILAIDQGTTSTRAILFDAGGRICYTARAELRQMRSVIQREVSRIKKRIIDTQQTVQQTQSSIPLNEPSGGSSTFKNCC